MRFQVRDGHESPTNGAGASHELPEGDWKHVNSEVLISRPVIYPLNVRHVQTFNRGRYLHKGNPTSILLHG